MRCIKKAQRIKGRKKWHKTREKVDGKSDEGRVLRDERPRCHYGRCGPVNCGRSARGSTGRCTQARMKWRGGDCWWTRGGAASWRRKRVLSQCDNDVSKRDQAAKMGKCLSSSPKCPLPDPFRWKLKWRRLDGKRFQFACKWSNIDSWDGSGGGGEGWMRWRRFADAGIYFVTAAFW